MAIRQLKIKIEAGEWYSFFGIARDQRENVNDVLCELVLAYNHSPEIRDKVKEVVAKLAEGRNLLKEKIHVSYVLPKGTGDIIAEDIEDAKEQAEKLLKENMPLFRAELVKVVMLKSNEEWVEKLFEGYSIKIFLSDKFNCFAKLEFNGQPYDSYDLRTILEDCEADDKTVMEDIIGWTFNISNDAYTKQYEHLFELFDVREIVSLLNAANPSVAKQMALNLGLIYKREINKGRAKDLLCDYSTFTHFKPSYYMVEGANKSLGYGIKMSYDDAITLLRDTTKEIYQHDNAVILTNWGEDDEVICFSD